MEDDAFFTADFADLRNVLDHADFIVDVHHRHQNGVRADGRLEFFNVDQAVFLHPR
jgi:hypothetical protein